jgi:hypothetical protein
MRRIIALCNAALIALLAVQSAFAQTVRGVLVEEGTRAPIEGGFVVLVDEHGRTLDEGVGALSDASGRFVLRAPGPGRYRLRAERIGFESTLSTLIELAVGETVDHLMVVPVQAVQLEELTVAADPVCDVRPDVGARTAEVWEEARKALGLVAWAESREMLQYRLVRHERELDPRTLRVQEERSWPSSWWTRGSPFRSLPPEELAEAGYVRSAAADSFVYYAPDAAVVLSESFAELHCFGIKVGGGDREGLIGLSFEPVPGRDLPDVEGVLWLDRTTAQLQYLEYRYTRLPLPVRSEKIGGRVEFQRLPSGVWIVSRWWIRMPIVWQYEPLHPLSDRFRLALIREEGGSVEDVRTAEGAPVRRGPGATLTGSVFDSTRVRPLVGATVFLVGGDQAAETDELGRFEIDGLPEGEYSLNFYHPSLDSLIFTPEPVVVALGRGQTTAVQMAVPSMGSILARLCPERRPQQATGAVVGVVRDVGSTAPVAGATVTATSDSSAAETTTDRGGHYRLCDLPVRTAISLQATHRGWTSAEAYLRLARAEVLRQDLELAPSRDADEPSPGLEPRITAQEAGGPAHPAVVRGRVLDRESGGPIGGLGVRLIGKEIELGRVTDGQGAFLFPRGVLVFNRHFVGLGRRCYPAIYIDGIRVNAAFGGPVVLDEFVIPEEVEAVEAYVGPASTPGEFAGSTARCGVIAVWTRSLP